jgi:Cu2+-exporting ATPase
MSPTTASLDSANSISNAEAARTLLDDPIEQGRFTRWISGTAGERWAESSLQLGGLHCAACAGLIEQVLAAVPGVQSARVSAAAERATVVWNPAQTQPAALIEAVQAAGYQAVPDAAAPAREMRRLAHRQALWRLFVAAFCAMQIMMMATPSYVAGPGELAPDLRQLLNWGSWLLCLPVLLFAAGPFFSGAWRLLRQRRIGMDVPVALGVAITFLASTAATFDPQGRFGDQVYFDSLSMFVSFLLGARYLELRARQGAEAALERTMACLPEVAWRIGADGQQQAVSVRKLLPGDRLRVPLGQAFAADGVLTEGQTQADESLLSGESSPVPKLVGDAVVAGSINTGAPVLMRVDRVGGDTRLEAIVSMMRSAMTQRPAAVRLADRWAGPFLWAVLLLAAGAAAVWSVIDPSRALWVAVSVLIVTCPCALSLAAPAALVAGARGMARRGVLLQRLDAIETLAGVQQVFFDKTGTLTEDGPRLGTQLLTAAGGHRFEGQAALALARAASLAQWSQHPLATALAQAGAQASPDLPMAWHGVQEFAGRGLRALDAQGHEWRLGSSLWVQGLPVDGEGQGDGDGGIAVWLGVAGQALARFQFEERLRPGVQAALQGLQAAGVRVTILTGDTAERARDLSARIGAADVIASATPESKLAAVAQAQAEGLRVAMVGDGINDAPVLAQADVSMAMGQGALVSRSQADAVITSNQPGDVLRALHSARRTVRIIHQNLWWAAGYNAVCIPLAVLGFLPPWAAGLGMASSSLLVVLNALRAMH